MYSQHTQVRLLRPDGQISTDIYLVEDDRNSGDIRLIKEDTIVRDDDGNIIKGTRIIANAQRVFPKDVIDKAPVINVSPDEAVAHCPKCKERHAVNSHDNHIVCTKHGQMELYRTKEQMHKPAKKAAGDKPARKDKAVKSVPAPIATPATISISDVQAIGELWSKRLNFDYSHIDARGYALLVDIGGTIYKHCFNTYNGSLGDKAGDCLERFKTTEKAYKVADVDKARAQLTAKGYDKVN